MALLLTMPDLSWTVRVERWTWTYKFSRSGAVTWRDPWNGMHGAGHWRIAGDKLKTSWGSKTTEEWDMPIDPDGTAGVCYMEAGTFDLHAVAQNYYLDPGDVVYSGDAIIRGNGTRATVVFPDEVRTGGTIAWICRNPGNIRQGEKFGAFKGKHLHVNVVGAYAIFPDEDTGLMAVISVLRGYGRKTILAAMNKYAGKEDPGNKPDEYAASVAQGLGVTVDTYLTTLSDEQMMRFASVISRVETAAKGRSWLIENPELPFDIRKRLRP